MTNELLLLDPVTDAEGRELSAQDVIDAAEKPIKVEFEHDGMKFMTWVRRSQVTMQQWTRISTIQATIGFKAGFKAGEDIDKIEPGDERMIEMLTLMNNSDSLNEAQAEAALVATITGADEILCTNVPQLRILVYADAITFLETTSLGQAYVKAVLEALRPTSTPAEAEAKKTKPANETESLTSLSSTNPETSQAIGSSIS